VRAETRIMLARASEAGMRSDRDWSESGSHARYRSPRNRGCLRATVSTVGSTSDGAASLAEQAPAAIESALSELVGSRSPGETTGSVARPRALLFA